MHTNMNQLARSQSQNMASLVRNLPNVGRHLSLGGRPGPMPCTPVSPIREEDPELSFSGQGVQRTDSGSLSVSMSRPLADSPSSSLARQMSGIKRTLSRVASLIPGNRQSFKSKQTLPGPGDFQGESWQGIEHYLRQRNRDSTPETLTVNKKPFYQRTWFACSIYGALLALLVAAILALAFTRSVVMPRMTLRGEILPGEVGSSQQNQFGGMPPMVPGSDGPSLGGLFSGIKVAPQAESTPSPVDLSTTPAAASGGMAPIVPSNDQASLPGLFNGVNTSQQTQLKPTPVVQNTVPAATGSQAASGEMAPIAPSNDKASLPGLFSGINTPQQTQLKPTPVVQNTVPAATESPVVPGGLLDISRMLLKNAS